METQIQSSPQFDSLMSIVEDYGKSFFAMFGPFFIKESEEIAKRKFNELFKTNVNLILKKMANYEQKGSSTSNGNLKFEIKTVVKKQFEEVVKRICSEEEQKQIPSMSEDYSEAVSNYVYDKVENPARDKKLEVLYNHQKQYLDILKEYKEEIKFASSLQAEIRKEQATFFSSTLKEVCIALKETQVDQKYQVQWIFDLVSSYTSSLELSSKLASEHVISLLGDIQKETEKTVTQE